MASLMEIGSGLAIRTSDRASLSSSANICRPLIRYDTRSRPSVPIWRSDRERRGRRLERTMAPCFPLWNDVTGCEVKTADTVKCEVLDSGELKSRRHLNVRGKSTTLPSITEKDWEDIKFGVDNKVDFYAVSFVKDAKVVHGLKDYLRLNPSQ